jgi:hypothetical protein
MHIMVILIKLYIMFQKEKRLSMALSALLPELLNKAGESLFTKFSFMWGIEQRREQLYNLLIIINQVITDAEEQA